MNDALFYTRTAHTRPWLHDQTTPLARVHHALLSTIDGHRSVIELESVARAMGLAPDALERLRQQGLIELRPAH